jgi:predicted O-methyltransferase YrrM
MTYKEILSPSGAPTEYFNQQPFYDWISARFTDGMKVLEIGVFAGRSAAFLASKIKERGLKMEFIAVDHFIGSPEHQAWLSEPLAKNPNYLYEMTVENMQKCDVADYVKVVKCDSVEFSKQFADEQFDFIFVDGGHEYESAKADIEAWYPKLKVGGVMAGDDYHPVWEGVMRAVDEKFPSKILYSEPNMHERFLPPSVWYITKT